MTVDEDLLFSLQRLSAEVAKDSRLVATVLADCLAGTLGALEDPERGRRYRVLGGLLIELGEVYRHEADTLDPVV